MENNEKEFYLGNQNIKRSGVIHQFTQEQTTEYIKCMKDPIYFINNYVKMNTLDGGVRNITLYPYQEELIKLYMNGRFILCIAPRQSAKCLCINTMVTVRNKRTNEIKQVTIGELYEYIKRKHDTVESNL